MLRENPFAEMPYMCKPFTAASCVVTVLLLSGCYHATIETGASPSQQVITKKFASGWLWGLIPPSTVDAEQSCTSGVARVETQHSFVNSLIAGLTGGIYTPMQIDVTCAGNGAAGAAPSQ
jgi:hypothetical protein